MSFDYKLFDYTMASTPAAITQYSVVLFDTVGNVKLPTAANNGGVAGIAQEPVTVAGQSVAVRYLGKSKAIALSAFGVGALVATGDATGKIAALAVPAAGQDTVGRSLEAGVNNGDFVSVLVNVISR